MKKLLSFLLVACFSTTLLAQTIVSTEPSNRNMILEEFTGKGCQYCPDGHKRAQQLMDDYPGRVFAINVHQGSFAGGTPNYRTPYGDALATQAGMGLYNTGYPAGTVARQLFEGIPKMGSSHFLYERTRWSQCVTKGLDEPSCLNVAAEGILDWEARKLTLLVEVYYTGNAVNETNKLTVAMLQNEILGPQSGGSTWYPEMMEGTQYRHQHMLRDFITGQWGMDVTPTTEGSFWSHTFEYDIPVHFNNVYTALSNVDFLVYVAENEKTIISGARANITNINKCYRITPTSGGNGTISPSDPQFFLEGESAEYTFTPNPGFEVSGVYVDEKSVGLAGVTSYTFPPLEKDHTIRVMFKRSPVGITDITGVTIGVEPNPVTDKLYVTGIYDKLEIISVSGQVLATAHGKPSIDVNHLAKGIYFVKIQVNGQTSTFKVVK